MNKSNAISVDASPKWIRQHAQHNMAVTFLNFLLLLMMKDWRIYIEGGTGQFVLDAK